MKWTRLILVILLITPAVIKYSPLVAMGDTDGQVSSTTVDEVTIELENRTGTLHLLFSAIGRAPAGTHHVNVSLGLENSTERTNIGRWLEPVDLDLSVVGVILSDEGPIEEPWTEWECRIWADVKMDSIFTTLEYLAPLLGIEGLEGIGDIEGLEDIQNIVEIEGLEGLSNLTDFLDPEEMIDQEEIMELLMDSSILFLARGYDDAGNFTEGEKDIKFDLLNAVFGFLIAEGMMDDPMANDDDDGPDPDDEVKEDGSEGTTGVLALIAVISGMLILVMVLAIIILMVSRNREK